MLIGEAPAALTIAMARLPARVPAPALIRRGSGSISTAASYWALGPLQAALTLFDGGRRAVGLRIAKAQYVEAAEAYRQTVLAAFAEVEDDLAGQRLLADAASRTNVLAFSQ